LPRVIEVHVYGISNPHRGDLSVAVVEQDEIIASEAIGAT
jgi:hypothetical protein